MFCGGGCGCWFRPRLRRELKTARVGPGFHRGPCGQALILRIFTDNASRVPYSFLLLSFPVMVVFILGRGFREHLRLFWKLPGCCGAGFPRLALRNLTSLGIEPRRSISQVERPGRRVPSVWIVGAGFPNNGPGLKSPATRTYLRPVG